MGSWGRGLGILTAFIACIGAGFGTGTPDAWARARVLPTVEPGSNDQASDLPGTRIQFDTLPALEQARLISGMMLEAPWSGDYWPIYQGVIARRYADPEFPRNDWKAGFLWAKREVGSGHCSVEKLSPAEKYDLLVGDAQYTLTRAMWTEGARFQDQSGKVEPWMGICEGWAGAAIAVPRPRHAVTVIAADGRTRIPFYPDDIKALASLLWSRGNVEKKLIGGRCNERSPARDAGGRPTNPDCQDTNPATWHLAVAHRIGAAHQGLVMDASFDYEVWNQPIYSYIYEYYNPATGAETTNLSEAVVARSAWAQDPYARFRSPRSVSIAGIKMTVDFVSETAASDAKGDDPSRDFHRRATYVYDLELDAHGKIVGGEWHNSVHPDFLWATASGKTARSQGDLYLDGAGDRSRWDGMSTLPAAWRQVAPATSKLGQPLERVVSALVMLSRIGAN